MHEEDNQHIIDVDYKDDTEVITTADQEQEPVYYNCMQVSKMLHEPDSRIRYWSKMFQPVLNIKTSNNVRKYTKTDIENLIFIKKLLKDDGLTIKQALEYCEKKGFDEAHGLVDTSNPLAIKAFIAAMSQEFKKTVDTMQKDLLIQQQQMMQDYINKVSSENETFKEDVVLTVDTAVSEKLDSFAGDINTKLDDFAGNINTKLDSLQQELEETKRLNESEDVMKNNMQQRKGHSEKTHWWDKIFKK